MQPSAFTTKFPGIARELRSTVHVGGPVTPNIANGERVTCPKTFFTGVWDTGATSTAITQRVIDACGLKPTGMTQVHHAAGVCNQPTFLITIFLPNRIAIPNIRVSRAELGNIDLLIGMDVISQGDFVITNHNGATWFTFRIPSLERFDFVKRLKPNPSKPCSCGSGKLYKNCCK